MNLAGAISIFFILAAIVVPAVLWGRLHQRERQLRSVQTERIMKSLREALLRENSADPGRNVGIVTEHFAIPGLSERSVRPPSHGVELSLVLYSQRH